MPMNPPQERHTLSPAGYPDPAEMTPAQRRAEIASILARGVLRVLHAAPKKDCGSPQKALDGGQDTSADARQRKQFP